MRIEKKELETALEVIRANNHGHLDRVTECLESVLKEMNEDKRNNVNLIDRDSYIATILWQKDDIRSMLQEKGIEPSDENVQAVLDNIMVGDLENCEYGWGVITDGIECAFPDSLHNGEKIKECIDSISYAIDTLDDLLRSAKAKGADTTASNAQCSHENGKTEPALPHVTGSTNCVSFEEAKRIDCQPFIVSPGCKTESRGWFTNLRVDRSTVPKGWFAYDIRHGDSGNFCSLEDVVVVNHAGTFLTQVPVKMNKQRYHSLMNGNWTFAENL